MHGREYTGAELDSGAVDSDFWALICADKEWLDTEFDAIVSDVLESPVWTGRSISDDIVPGSGAEQSLWELRATRPWRTGIRPGRHWERERGPPPLVSGFRSRTLAF